MCCFYAMLYFTMFCLKYSIRLKYSVSGIPCNVICGMLCVFFFMRDPLIYVVMESVLSPQYIANWYGTYEDRRLYCCCCYGVVVLLVCW